MFSSAFVHTCSKMYLPKFQLLGVGAHLHRKWNMLNIVRQTLSGQIFPTIFSLWVLYINLLGQRIKQISHWMSFQARPCIIVWEWNCNSVIFSTVFGHYLQQIWNTSREVFLFTFPARHILRSRRGHFPFRSLWTQDLRWRIHKSRNYAHFSPSTQRFWWLSGFTPTKCFKAQPKSMTLFQTSDNSRMGEQVSFLNLGRGSVLPPSFACRHWIRRWRDPLFLHKTFSESLWQVFDIQSETKQNFPWHCICRFWPCSFFVLRKPVHKNATSTELE